MIGFGSMCNHVTIVRPKKATGGQLCSLAFSLEFWMEIEIMFSFV
jgi:hypothetical protein